MHDESAMNDEERDDDDDDDDEESDDAREPNGGSTCRWIKWVERSYLLLSFSSCLNLIVN